MCLSDSDSGMAFYRRHYRRHRTAVRTYRKRSYKRRTPVRRTYARRTYAARRPVYRRRSYASRRSSSALGTAALKCYRKYGDAPICQAKEVKAAASHQRRAATYEAKKPAAIAKGISRVAKQFEKLSQATSGDATMGASGIKRDANAAFNQ